MRYANLVATGMYLPPNRVPNDVFRERLKAFAPDFVDKMEEGSGIRQRWYANEDQKTSDLAAEAARDALAAARVDPEEVDLVLLGTDSPDYITPATSTVLQHKIGAKNAGTFDVGCACASFPTAFAAAAGMIAADRSIRTAVIAGAYLMHRLADPDDPMTFFYGDGAGAAVLQAGDTPGFIASAFAADGSYAEYWGVFAGGTAEPASVEAVTAGRTRVRMLQRYPPEINHDGWPRLVRRVAEHGGFDVKDIDFAIFTQVRKPSIELVMQALELPMTKTHTVMEDWGYTGSACIPMALHDAREKKLVKPGDLVVLVGSGVGMNQAAVAYRA